MPFWKFECKSCESKKEHAKMLLKLGDKAYWMSFLLPLGFLLKLNDASLIELRDLLVAICISSLLGFFFTKKGIEKLDELQGIKDL